MFIEWAMVLDQKNYEVRFEHEVNWNNAGYNLQVNGERVFEHKYTLMGPALPFDIPVLLNEQAGSVVVRKGRRHIFAELYLDGNLLPTSDATPGWETGNPFDT